MPARDQFDIADTADLAAFARALRIERALVMAAELPLHAGRSRWIPIQHRRVLTNSCTERKAERRNWFFERSRKKRLF